MEANAVSGGLISPEPEDVTATGRPRLLNNRWLVVSAAVMTVLAGVITAAGFLAIRSHEQTESLGATDAVALAAAKDCISATQPIDVAALPASLQKLIDCSTGDFGSQAQWYGAVLDEAYRAVNVEVRVPEMYAAVERHDDDGSIIAMVAFRAIVSQPGGADRENGYRVRVRMVPDNGIFKVANLDQVAQ